MIEYALLIDGAFSGTRVMPERPDDIPHKAVRWLPVKRQTGQTAGAREAGGEWVITTVAPAPQARESHAAWLRLALIEIGKLDAVEAAVDAAGPSTRALWDFATTIRETDPEVLAIGAGLSIDLPALFDRANAIRAGRGQ